MVWGMCLNDFMRKWAGRSSRKKRAQAAATKRWRANHYERVRASEVASAARNRAQRNAFSRTYVQRNREAVLEMQRDWARRNRPKHVLSTQQRRAARYSATPAWARTEFERFAMAELCDLAERRRKSTGTAWHVDHKVPLRSPLVCGLHCVANLEVIPGLDNHRKGNRHWADMPVAASPDSE